MEEFICEQSVDDLVTSCWFFSIYSGLTNIHSTMQKVYPLVLSRIEENGYPEDVFLFVEKVVLESQSAKEDIEDISQNTLTNENEIQKIESLFISQCGWKEFPSYLRESLYNTFKYRH